MALGLVIARWARVRVSIALALLIECALLVAIRDNLTLNIIQLVAPVEAISAWQAAG